MPADQSPTVADIERIAALQDPVICNLQITQCYFELARSVEIRTGGNACWCTFATWASRQAGQTIRKQDLTRTLEHVLGTEQDARAAAGELSTAIEKLGAKPGTGQILTLALNALDPEAAFERSSQAVARGNLKVFTEIGRAFARFNAVCLDDQRFDPAKIKLFCDGLLPGDPPEGQRYLRQAFERYYRAFFEPDSKAQAELVLLANLEIGFHEQTRLQPEINAALAAPVIPPDLFARNLLRALRPNWGQLNDLVWWLLRFLGRLSGLEAAIQTYLNGAQRQAQWIVTESMMTIEFPKGKLLRLGLDVEGAYPPDLQQLTNPDLLDLLATIDPNPAGTESSGAKYWGDLSDRMGFIAELFRCYQNDPTLVLPPFSAEQTIAIKAAQLPQGRL